MIIECVCVYAELAGNKGEKLDLLEFRNFKEDSHRTEAHTLWEDM